jgi:uncharacterized small protein (DUF1192 family)
MNSDLLVQAVILIVSNAVTAWFTNSATKKKHSAEAANYISDAYKTLVDELQNQITIMKSEIDELKNKITAMDARERQLSIKVGRLEAENTSLREDKK